MKTIRVLLPLLLVLGSVALTRAADDDKPILEFKRLDLLDKRVLRDVVVRSYDARTDKLLVVAAGKAMTIPASAVPAPLADQLRQHAPSSGSTVSSGGNPPPQPPPVRPSRHDHSPPASAPSRSDATAREDAAAHRAVAIDRARTFFRYEFKAGSDAIRVDSVKIDAGPATPVAGWSGRYRTQGTAYLEIFDTKGWSATRAQSTFEIITEQKPNEPPTVIDFSRKG
jgi:hypothetical protein